MSTISKNIRKLREQKGISQDRLSKLADISLNTIAKLELDDNQNPTIDTLSKIAKALEVKVDDLIQK
jgi:transcriptional regulator with XRE-family HTH domain